MTDENKNSSCMDCPTRCTTEWQVLNEFESSQLDRAKRIIDYQPGDMLYCQGDAGNGVYCIKSGLIGLRRVSANGNSVLVRLSSTGSTVGYRTFLTKEPHLNSAEVLETSEMCYIPRPHIEKLLNGNPRLGERFLQHFIDEAIETENNYARNLTMGMKSRFLHLMLVFYERVGYQDESGNAILELPVKRSELAELVGVRPESISRLIDKLQSEQVMHFKDRRVHISDFPTVLSQAGATV